jgi:hypothetical protein
MRKGMNDNTGTRLKAKIVKPNAGRTGTGKVRTFRCMEENSITKWIMKHKRHER